MIYKSGLFIESIFKQGVMEGEGLMIFPNGIEYYGTFKKGLLEGFGTASIGGELHKGKFLKGNFSNELVYTNNSNVHFVFENKSDWTQMNGNI